MLVWRRGHVEGGNGQMQILPSKSGSTTQQEAPQDQ